MTITTNPTYYVRQFEDGTVQVTMDQQGYQQWQSDIEELHRLRQMIDYANNPQQSQEPQEPQATVVEQLMSLPLEKPKRARGK
jgi:ABC-type xylose transport system substrate-binding protein